MDSNELEHERGITILAKVTSLLWKDTRINIVDTPGHADFGGEVERILNMVDGAILLVDAAEGPMPQTKFVLMKALAIGLKPIVVINKVDRSDAQPDVGAERGLRSLRRARRQRRAARFPGPLRLGQAGLDGAQAGGPEGIDRAAARQGAGARRAAGDRAGAVPHAGDDARGRSVPRTAADGTHPLGLGAGRPDRQGAVARPARTVETFRVSKVLAFRGLERHAIEQGDAGDIVAIAGLTEASVADTLAIPQSSEPIPAQPIDPPTLSMTFRINDGPLAGQEGDKVQSRVIRDRLLREAEGNVALKITEGDDKDSFEVAGRGELQLGILIETMRREGFELTIGKPRVVTREENGETLEPIEEVIIDVDDEHTGVVIETLVEPQRRARRHAPLGRRPHAAPLLHPDARADRLPAASSSPTRAAPAIMNRIFHDYEPFRGEIPGRRNGVLLSNSQGEAVAYALFNLQDRGPMMIEPGTKVYEGMIVGEHTRDNDLEVNVMKGKQLTNIRASGKDEAVLTPPMQLSLEQALSYIEDDELVEVTPKSIRLRKRYLDSNERKRMERQAAAMAG